MDRLPKATIRILKKVNAMKQFRITPSNIGDLKILNDLKYIDFYKEINLDNLINDSNWINYFTITTAGTLYLETIKHEKLKFLIPTAISIIALISSFREEIYQLIRWLLP